MRLTLPIIMDALLPFSPAVTNTSLESPAFRAVKIFSADDASPHPDCLYVADEAALRLFLAKHAEFSGFVICVADEPLASRLKSPHIHISEPYTHSQVFNCLYELFYTVLSWEANLNKVIFTQGTLQQLTDLGHTLLKAPLMVWDSCFNILAASGCECFLNTSLEHVVTHRALPNVLIRNIIATDQMCTAEQSGIIRHICKTDVFEYPGYLCSYFHNGLRSCMASLTYVDDPPTQGQLDLLRVFFDKVGELHHLKAAKLPNMHHPYESFLNELLRGDPLDRETMADRSFAFKMPIEQSYLLYIIEFDHFSRPQADFLAQTLLLSLSSSYISIMDQRVCLLKPLQSYICGVADREDFDTLLQFYKGRCAISKAFSSLYQVHAAYEQCLFTLESGRRFVGQSELPTRIYFYSDCAFYHSLSMYGCTQNLFSLLPQKYVEFYLADRKKGNRDLKLLQTYVECGLSAAAAAQALFLHRNSVIYRIKQIEQYLNTSLQNADTLFYVMLLLKVSNYLNGAEKRPIGSIDENILER